jgi:hypothetical protein
LPITGTVYIVHIALTRYPEPIRHAWHVMPLDPGPALPRPNGLRLCPFLGLPTQMPPSHEIVRDQVETHDVHGDAQRGYDDLRGATRHPNERLWRGVSAAQATQAAQAADKCGYDGRERRAVGQ